MGFPVRLAPRRTVGEPVDLAQLVFLALVQGLTEFLPISSSAHLVLPAKLWGWSDQGLAFDIGVHLGSLLAVMWYFRDPLRALLASLARFIGNGTRDPHTALLGHLIIATLPIVIVGAFAKDWVSVDARSIVVIATATGAFGLLLWFADRRAATNPRRSELQLRWQDALIIGCFQVLAVIPGTSRSGITMTAGLLLNLSREATARFSFLLSVPTILGAATLASLDALHSGTRLAWSDIVLGLLVSAMAAYVCIHLFIRLIERIGMTPFVIYRVLLSLVLFGVAFGGS